MEPTKISLSVILRFIIPLAMAHYPFTMQNFAAEDLLDAHNKARAEAGIRPLKWDDTVAASYAFGRVGDCNLVHSQGPYGENIAESSADVSAAEYFKMWVDEKQYYDPHSNKRTGGDCLHCTQVVWKNSVSVGCAQEQCKNNGWFFVTCNNNPPGNFIGEHPY